MEGLDDDLEQVGGGRKKNFILGDAQVPGRRRI